MRWLRRRRSRAKATTVNVKMSIGWWLTLPLIVNGEPTTVEVLVEPEEIPALLKTWRRNGVVTPEVGADYTIRHGVGQTGPQREASSKGPTRA